MHRVAVALVLVLVVATPGFGDAVPPSVRCQAAKIWIAGRYVARRPACRTPACGTAWNRDLAQAFSDVERRGGCLTRDDALSVQAMAHAFETKLAAMLRRRDRPCARMFVAATARWAGVSIRSQRPVWPPQEHPFSNERRQASDRFDRDRFYAKTLRGCRSVILGSKLGWPARVVEEDVVRALLPPEVATGLRVDLPAGWHLHDVSPGRAEFVTFPEYYHGGVMPAGGADLSVYVNDDTVDQWLGNLTGSLDHRDLEHLTIDGSDAVRLVETIRPSEESGADDFQQRVLSILLPSERLTLSFSWYIGDEHHPNDVEQIVRTARFFPSGWRRTAINAQ